MANHFEQAGIAEMRNDLRDLLGKHAYVRMIGDTEVTPYSGFVESLGEATVVLVNVTEAVPARPGNRLRDAEPETPSMRERHRLRIDHVLSVTEVTVATEADLEPNEYIDLGDVGAGVDTDADADPDLLGVRVPEPAPEIITVTPTEDRV